MNPCCGYQLLAQVVFTFLTQVFLDPTLDRRDTIVRSHLYKSVPLYLKDGAIEWKQNSGLFRNDSGEQPKLVTIIASGQPSALFAVAKTFDGFPAGPDQRARGLIAGFQVEARNAESDRRTALRELAL